MSVFTVGFSCVNKFAVKPDTNFKIRKNVPSLSYLFSFLSKNSPFHPSYPFSHRTAAMTTKGQSISVWSEQFPPAPQWTAKDIPDLSGKVCAVTGGYGGIGYETTVRIVGSPKRSVSQASSLHCRKHCSNIPPRYTSSVELEANLTTVSLVYPPSPPTNPSSSLVTSLRKRPANPQGSNCSRSNLPSTSCFARLVSHGCHTIQSPMMGTRWSFMPTSLAITSCSNRSGRHWNGAMTRAGTRVG